MTFPHACISHRGDDGAVQVVREEHCKEVVVCYRHRECEGARDGVEGEDEGERGEEFHGYPGGAAGEREGGVGGGGAAKGVVG